jgi:integrase
LRARGSPLRRLRPKGAGWQIRLHEKGGKHHTMPCHHALAEALHAYIDAAALAEYRKGVLFRTARGHNCTSLSEQPMTQPDAWRMIRRRAAAAGIHAPIGNHSFRATGITAYVSNGGALEHAQEMAAHESPRTTSSTIGRRSGLPRTRWSVSGSDTFL